METVREEFDSDVDMEQSFEVMSSEHEQLDNQTIPKCPWEPPGPNISTSNEDNNLENSQYPGENEQRGLNDLNRPNYSEQRSRLKIEELNKTVKDLQEELRKTREGANVHEEKIDKGAVNDKVEEWLDTCPSIAECSKVSGSVGVPPSETISEHLDFPALHCDLVQDEDYYPPDDSDSDEDESMVDSSSEVIDNQGKTENTYVSQAKSRGKKDGYFLDRRQYCFFCQNGQLNLARHISKIHFQEKEVAAMLSYKELGEMRKYQLTLTKLRCAGNFKHNIKILNAGGTNIVVVKRPSQKRRADKFFPCPHCYGFYYKAEMWRHAKKCPLKDGITEEEKDKSVLKQSKLLLDSACLHTDGCSEMMRGLIAGMRPDSVTTVASNDILLCKLGEMLLKKYGPSKKNDISQRMRQLARLLIECRDLVKVQLTFSDLLCGKHFDTCLEAASNLCGLTITPDGRRIFKIPSLALRLGHLLKKIAIVKRGSCLRKDDIEQVKETETFEKLLIDEWTDAVSSNALNTLKRRKDQTVEQLPETEDLLKLKDFQANVIKQAMSQLTDSLFYNTWRRLAQNVLARLIIFNKRRAGEVARLTLATYKDRPDWKVTGHSEIAASLQPLEKKMLECTDLVMVPGKRNRKVPILIPQDVSDAMRILMDTREQVGIPSQNAFFFSSRSSNGYLDGWQAVNASSSEACLKNPQLVTSTKCRKYNVTITQLLDLAPTDVEWLANHMGHSVNIHKEFYRQQESTIEITKVGKLLAAVDSGTGLKTSPTPLNVNMEQSEVSTDDSEEEKTSLPHKEQRKRKARKLSTSSENESIDKFISRDKEESKCEKLNTLLQDDDRLIPTSGKKIKNDFGSKVCCRWTSEQEYALRDQFSDHLAQKIYPSGSQINIRKRNSPFASKSTAQIKSKLQYMMKKAN